VWGGTATLVEELSIGAEIGDEPYLFGRVAAAAATDEAIFVLDAQIPAVRAYDRRGVYLRDIGREGPGPGEYAGPRGLDVDASGNLYVLASGEIEVFAPNGDPIDTWRVDSPAPFAQSVELVVGGDGTAYRAETIERNLEQPWRSTFGIAAYAEGERRGPHPLPDVGYETPVLVLERRSEQSYAWGINYPPFAAWLVWAASPTGAIVIGAGNRYRFEHHRSDGTVLAVEKYWDPVPVDPGEAAWYERRVRASIRRADSTSGWDIDGGLPDHKPAFQRMVVGRDGNTWVVRAGAGERLPGCAEGDFSRNPCWRQTYSADVFGDDGRFLGNVSLPPELQRQSPFPFVPRPFIHGDTIIAPVEDDNGTAYVKRYRLALPEPLRER
jgi:hypothetical protein